MKMKRLRSGRAAKAASVSARLRRAAPAGSKAPGKGRSPKSKDASSTRPPLAHVRPPLHIPPILLEDDESCPLPTPGPGQKYAPGLAPQIDLEEPEAAELPKAYGTGTLLLAARDPRCLYAHWDLAPQQQRHLNALAADHHLDLRVYEDTPASHMVAEIQLHPESQHWFVHVPHADAKYFGELGYRSPGGQWAKVATSAAVTTPADSPAQEQAVRLVTILAPAPAPSPAHARTVVPEAAPEAPTIVAADPGPAGLGVPGSPFTAPVAGQGGVCPPGVTSGEQAVDTSPASEQRPHSELAHSPGQPPPASPPAEGALAGELTLMASPTPAKWGRLAGTAPCESPTSPGGEARAISDASMGGAEWPKGFWLNVNAELVIYGATEPDAQVSIGGRPIQLRADGTFSCRFALPDGSYDLAIAATSARHDHRQAGLRFSRRTEYHGEAGVHPPDVPLATPAAENGAGF